MINKKRLDEWHRLAGKALGGTLPMSAYQIAPSELAELIRLARLGLKVVNKPGPAGPDRRWKMACETALKRSFDTPREMMDHLAVLPKEKA